MKYLLISLNVLLAVALGYLAWTYTHDPDDSASKLQTVSHDKVDKKKTAGKVSPLQISVVESPELTEQKITALLSRNIFNTERVPDAPANRTNRNNQQQIRADMRLVGTYIIGDSLGAIILQRLQGNSQQQLKALQQKEYEQYSSSATRVTDPKKKNATAGTTDAKSAAEAADNSADEEVADAEKKTFVAGNATVSANNVFRQFLKVGDTTVNGYKLAEVTRTSAVLTKGSERIELTLLSPSEAGNFARQQNNNTNNRNNNNRNNNNNTNNNNNNNRNNQQANRNNNNNNNRNNQQANRNNNNTARNNNASRNSNNNNNRNNNASRNNNRNNDDIEWF